MNSIAQGVEQGGGDIIGIMPEFLIMKEKLNHYSGGGRIFN